jgi:DNA-binding response OmpR family regulator
LESHGVPVELPQVIDQATDISSQHMGGRQVTIVAEFPAHLPAVKADQATLVSAVACLLARAGTLTGSHEVTVRVELLSAGDKPDTLRVMGGEPDQLSQSGPWALLRISFADDGHGALDVLAQFGRPEEGRNWPIPGCEAMLSDFGPDLWLESDQAHVTRFGLALPLWAVNETVADVSSLRQAVETRLSEAGAEIKTLLIMVDDPDLRVILARDLEAEDHHVVMAESGEEVLSLARKVRPDMVLLDLMSRAPTAFEVAAILKYDRRTRNTPVMFLTSADDPKGGVSMGAVSFLARHDDTGSLVSAIQAVLTSGLEPLGRVLVVESDDHLRERMVMTIQAENFRVSEARTASEAMALAERVPPGIALVNDKIAEERDYWLIRGLRQISPQAMIFVMADVLSEEEGRLAIRRGASGYSETGKLPDLLDRVRQDKGGTPS